MSGVGVARTYDDFRTVTASDSAADPAGPFAGLLVIAAGAIKLTTVQGTTVTISNTVVGQEIHVPVSRVWSTGTAGSVLGMIALPYKPRGTTT